MQQVMFWVGIGWSVLSATTAFLTALGKIFPKAPFFATAAAVLGTLALDVQKILGVESPT